MTAQKPSLDELIAAQRAAVGMTEAQRARNRARLLSRAVAGGAASVSAASSLAAAAPSGALSLVAKIALCVLLVGGAGAAYFTTRPSAVPAASTQPTQNQPPNALQPSATPAEPTPVESAAAVVSLPVAAKPRAARPGATSSASSLAAEVALMHDVDSALRAGHPESALALLDGQRGSGAGFMAEERAVAHIVTLCQLGRVDQARAEAGRFLRDRPRSPLASRVRATCAKPTESGQPG